MPALTTLAWALWIATAAMQAALLAGACLNRSLGRWRALTAFLALRTVTTAALMSVAAAGAASWYSGIYYASSCASAGLRVWIIADLACALTRAAYSWKPAVRLGSFLFAASMTALGTVMLVGGKPELVQLADWIATTGTRVLCFAWVGTFAFIVCAGEQLGLKWDRKDSGIAFGLAIQASSACLILWLFTFFPSIAAMSNVQDGAYALSLGVWAVAMMRREDATAPGIDQLREISAPILELGRKLRG